MRVARQLDGVNPKDLLLTTLLNNKFFSMTLFNKKSYTTICFVSFFFIRFSMSILQIKSAGGDDGIRTHDPLLAGQVLSQLSYTPERFVVFSILARIVLGRTTRFKLCLCTSALALSRW